MRRYVMTPTALSVVLLCAAGCSSLHAQIGGQTTHITSARPTMQTNGTFDVAIKPAEPSELAQTAGVGRMTIDKTWAGGLVGTSKGEMLTGVTPENASMAYVAMERFTGAVDGHQGTFLFSHSAAMQNNQPRAEDLSITVVPASGTGQLQGIEGRLLLELQSAKHAYTFVYTLPAQH